MNKARRMVAMQCRALAEAGGVAAVVDLRGTGDSGGEHGDATWDGWRDEGALVRPLVYCKYLLERKNKGKRTAPGGTSSRTILPSGGRRYSPDRSS